MTFSRCSTHDFFMVQRQGPTPAGLHARGWPELEIGDEEIEGSAAYPITWSARSSSDGGICGGTTAFPPTLRLVTLPDHCSTTALKRRMLYGQASTGPFMLPSLL
jgi:hypothetical protein